MIRRTKIVLIGIITCLFAGCASQGTSIGDNAYLQQGQRDFKAGYYRQTLRELMPLAQAQNPKAQYTVGYLYYYGRGVAQDKEIGIIWIERAAKQHYAPAVKALKIIRSHAVSHD